MEIMERKIIRIMIVMLLISTTIVPLVTGINVDNNSDKLETSIQMIQPTQPDLVAYEDGSTAPSGDNIYNPPSSPDSQFWQSFAHIGQFLYFFKLEVQNDGPGGINCTIAISLNMGGFLIGWISYPVWDGGSNTQFFTQANLPLTTDFVDISLVGDSVVMWLGVLTTPFHPAFSLIVTATDEDIGGLTDSGYADP
jgi:hypothetical protein